MLIVLTMRRLEVGRNDALTEALAAVARRPGSRRLHLRGLGERDTRALLDALTSQAVDPAVAATIHERSDGNPFFAAELLRLVLGSSGSDGSRPGDVPAGVGDVLRRRLTQLPGETRELLSVAAVVGREVELGLLSRLTDEPFDVVLDRLEPALVHRLLHDDPDRPSTFRFSHALVREVLVEDLPLLRRARLHLRVADAIETGDVTDDDAEVLAEHLWRAVAVGGGQRAAAALERAAEVAIRRVAFASAEELLSRAIELRRATASGPEDLEAELLTIHRHLTVARARRYFAAAATPELIDRAKELARRTGRQDVLADVLWVEWSAATTGGRIDDAVALADSFIGLLEASDDPGLRAFGIVSSGILDWQLGRMSDAVAKVDRGAEMMAAAAGDVDASLEFAAERQLLGVLFGALFHSIVGDDPDAPARLEQLAAEQQDRFVLTEVSAFAVVACEALGDWDRAERIGRRVLALDPDAEFSFYTPMSLMALAEVMAHRGELDDAREMFRDARDRFLEVGGGAGLATHDASWAIGLAAAGETEEAVAAVKVARETLDTLQEMWNEPIVLLAEGVVAHATGDREVAAERLQLAFDVAARQGSHGVARRAAATAADLGVPIQSPTDPIGNQY